MPLPSSSQTRLKCLFTKGSGKKCWLVWLFERIESKPNVELVTGWRWKLLVGKENKRDLPFLENVGSLSVTHTFQFLIKMFANLPPCCCEIHKTKVELQKQMTNSQNDNKTQLKWFWVGGEQYHQITFAFYNIICRWICGTLVWYKEWIEKLIWTAKGKEGKKIILYKELKNMVSCGIYMHT